MLSNLLSRFVHFEAALFERVCPIWYNAFSDNALGGFYERLDEKGAPSLTGQRRLLTQCRQLAVYSDASLRDGHLLYKNLKGKFEFILDRYHDSKTGLWCFSLDDDGAVKDRTCDLYTLAFVVFSFSHYYRATKDGRAKIASDQVLRLIGSAFRMKDRPGFAEAIGVDFKPLPLVRRQNPHMHLLEACLFACQAWSDPAYEDMADEMVRLFYDYFYQVEGERLCEFFTDDLKAHPEKGNHFEAGHFYEWIWLLKKHALLKRDPSRHDPVCKALASYADRHGWDEGVGGLYDVLDRDGNVLDASKRIWPLCEALKAQALMGDEKRLEKMLDVFEEQYLQENGFWREWLNRDLSLKADYLPGTTPYHIYFGLTETTRILEDV